MMINIRKPFFTLLCCGILASCGKAPVGTPTVQPNLLMVTFDTLRADHLGAYGSGAGLTPNFDALAEKSVMFDNAYAVSSTTAPSHATIFSGLYPNEHGVLKNGVALSGDVTTVAEVLRDYGYSTAAFVSSYVLGELFDLDQALTFTTKTSTLSAGAWGCLLLRPQVSGLVSSRTISPGVFGYISWTPTSLIGNLLSTSIHT
jgi:membrane-anchored protein YejM (alkaline phosphatase superfamily)